MTSVPAEKNAIERLARHLATRDPADWPAFIEDAAGILALLKEPDAAMREVGDGAVWQRMIDAALTGRWSLAQSVEGAQEPLPPGGADEEGDIAFHPDDPGAHDRAGWVHINSDKET